MYFHYESCPIGLFPMFMDSIPTGIGGGAFCGVDWKQYGIGGTGRAPPRPSEGGGDWLTWWAFVQHAEVGALSRSATSGDLTCTPVGTH